MRTTNFVQIAYNNLDRGLFVMPKPSLMNRL